MAKCHPTIVAVPQGDFQKKENGIIKGILQARKEGHSRDYGATWLGQQAEEVKQWEIPCLAQSSNYWIKNQYHLAMVCSRERDIRPGGWFEIDTTWREIYQGVVIVLWLILDVAAIFFTQ
ncbi:hypothetical protein PAMP_003482 [Pampus punctatissimus]